MYFQKITGLACLVFFFTLGHFASAQNINIQGKVIDANTLEPLIFANIIVNGGTYGASTDLDGNFSLSLPRNQIKSIRFSYIGYQPFDYFVRSAEDLEPLKFALTIKLIEQSESLREVLVESGENPAHRIIKAAVKNRRKNDPERIASFTYEAYSKFVITLDEANPSDSSEIIAQTLDSSDINMLNHLESHHLFMAESVTERRYIAPRHNKEIILANRVAGFQNPGFLALKADFQTFSFYKDYVKLLDVNFLSPISPGATENYFFAIEDTTFYEEDTVFVISFVPFPGKNFNALEGMVYINTNQYALQNVVAHTIADEGLVDFAIEQRYEKFEEYYWFPTQLQADIIFNEMKVAGQKLKGFTRTYLNNVNIHPELYRRNFDEVTLEIDRNAVSRPDAYWEKYRVKPLENKEQKTYSFLDSLGTRFKFDRMVQLSESLSTGRYPLGVVDLDLSSILKINRFEGARLGLGLYTNDRLHPSIQFGGYLAYGTKDGRFKYGFSGDYALFKKFDVRLAAAYRNDVREPANVNFLENKPLLSNRSLRYFLTQRMDKVQSGLLSVFWRPLRDIQMKLAYTREEVEPLYAYQYQPSDGEALPDSDRFNFSEVSVDLAYAHKQEYLKTGQKRLFLKSSSPRVYLNYTRGGRFLGGEFDYHKITSKINHVFQLRTLGQLEIQLEGGYLSGNAPYPSLFQGKGLTRQVPVLVDHQFQTMELYEFLSDRYVYLFINHHFGTLLFKTNSQVFRPELSLAHHMGWGDVSDPEAHLEIDFERLNSVFYESGFYFDNVLRIKYFDVAYLGLGAGVFFRYGPYANSEFFQNTYFKITSTFSFR